MGLFSKETPASADRISETPKRTVQSASRPETSTVIARGTSIEGLLQGGQDLRIDGELSGEIRSSAEVRVGASGNIKAQIRARSIQVAGRVEGNLTADERIELMASAVVVGNLLAPKILIKEGANLQGSVDMSAPGSKEKTGGKSRQKDTSPASKKNAGKAAG